ncbi:MAG: hypothetical protein COT74_08250 [Bdellovibrionales bacterium CG10_big_fil_rev_8_21_14_0_10_45_34]|nr:MAG: hypothetical protein COT74_08250 [Bdellovibrionales bacterium CG10_big_fil_rev_8_21_14_0_10_45_34]
MNLVEVKRRSELKKFLDVPKAIYDPKVYPKYVHPLKLHVRSMLGNLDSNNRKLFFAYDDTGLLGRIGFKIHKKNGLERLHFGFFECRPDRTDVSAALINAGRKAFPEYEVMGPFHFRVEDPYVGVLVEGFDRDPFFLMSYNPPEYDHLLKSAGLGPAMDLFTYQVENGASIVASEAIRENSELATSSGVSIRCLDKKELRAEAYRIARIFNDALSNNWGFEEFLQDQVNEMVSLLKFFVDPRVVSFAIKDGKEVGCLIMLPNYNRLIKTSRGGLGPRLLWNFLTKRNQISEARGYALGVLKSHHGLGIGSLLTRDMALRGYECGYISAEISWVLSNNGPMKELSKAMGGKHNKVYRIYKGGPNLEPISS